MTKQVLKFINDELVKLGVNYEFGEWSEENVPTTYFIGEYQEEEPLNEDGLQDTTFILTGTTRSTLLGLEDIKEKIENNFPQIEGKTAVLENGSGIAVFYSNSFSVPTGNDELKRIQINLKIKEWKVN